MSEVFHTNIILIGASAGGRNALIQCLPLLPPNFTCPIVIVQHRHRHSEDSLIEDLGQSCQLEVSEAEDGEYIQEQHIYVAPANYHLLINRKYQFELNVDAPVNNARPAIDVLFKSAAEVYHERVIALVLTGAGFDGSHGAKYVKDCGGILICQNPQNAYMSYMPENASKAAATDFILDLNEIPNKLIELCSTPPGGLDGN